MRAELSPCDTWLMPSERRLVIDGVGTIELLPRAGYEASFVCERPVIGFAFEGQAGTHAFATSRRSAFRGKPNHISWVPRGCDVYSQSATGGEYLKITLEPGRVNGAAAGHRFSNVIDRTAIAAAQRLRRLLLGRTVEVLSCEREVSLLEERTRGILAGEARRSRPAAWMTPRRLSLIDELIEARLDGRLTVNELAATLGLSDGFFSRAFAAAVGKPPHDYIIDRRIARARSLLASRHLDLVAIALASGFASHAHMTALFRERLGASPSDIRRASGG